MTLFLVQHGEAKSEAEDAQRSLTDQGAETVEKMAAWAVRTGIKLDQIRHSGKKRAEQTAAVFAKHLNPQRGVRGATGLNPNDDVRLFAGSLRGQQESIMLVGHLPHLSKLVGYLLTGDPEIKIVRFRNAGIVCLSHKENKWAVEWVMQPELLGKSE
jgi:phosphohistidine phosphatase